jgi:parallel beta-helix repeat protein
MNHNGVRPGDDIRGASCHFNNVTNLVIRDTQVNDTFSEAAGFIFMVNALQLFSSKNITVSNSTFNNTNNGVAKPFTVLCEGMLCGACVNAHISDCQFNGSTNDTGVFVGSVLGSEQVGFLWENCQFSGLRSKNSSLPNAFHVSDQPPSTGSSGNKIVNCQFNNNHNVGGTEFMTALMYLDIDNLVVENCQISRLISDGDGNNFAFYLQAHTPDIDNIDISSMESIRIKNCTITEVKGQGKVAGIMLLDKTGGPPYNPFDVNPELTNVVIEDTVISRIHSSSESELVAGICSRDGIPSDATELPYKASDLSVSRCKISNVKRTVEGSSDNVAGIYLDDVKRPILENNNINNTNIGILLTSHENTEDVVDGLVQENKVLNCSVGYRDTSATTTNSFLKNVSKNNGTHFDVNWDVFPAPIQVGYAGGNPYYNVQL